MKNWMIDADGDIVIVMRAGDRIRNQSIIRVASISRKKITRYRSNKVPKWIIAEALDVLNIDYEPSHIHDMLKCLSVGGTATL